MHFLPACVAPVLLQEKSYDMLKSLRTGPTVNES